MVGGIIIVCKTYSTLISSPMENENMAANDERMKWWREARFGMFIHWGLYSIPGGEWKWRRSLLEPAEWIMHELMIPDRVYRRLAREFNPAGFDAIEWARIARDTGMKYIVITAKHHDGFCLFDSKLTDYTTVKGTPFGRDAIAEVGEACREHGIRFGIYYSLLDWHWSLFPGTFGFIPNFGEYYDYMKEQLRELLTGYGEVSVLFFDGDWMAQWNNRLGREVETLCRSFQPDVIINNRLQKRSLLSILPAFQRFTMKTRIGDYETPEQFIPAGRLHRDWETCMTMNTSWGYRRSDNKWKSAETLTGHLEDITSKGGNFLLNVGPDGTGEIPGESRRILEEIGQWMGENEEKIRPAGGDTRK